MSTLQTSNQFPERKDMSGLYSKVYADICFLLSADINKDRAILMGNFLNKHYLKVITPQDLMQAFEMYITDKLDDYLQADKNGFIDKSTYNKIDPALIQKVIKAYRLYRQKNKPKKEVKALPESREKKIEAENYTIDSIIKCFNEWKNSGDIVIPAPMVIVYRLKDCGLYVERELNEDILNKSLQDLKYSKDTSRGKREIVRAGAVFSNIGLVDHAEGFRLIESIKASFEMIEFNEINLQDELDRTRVYSDKTTESNNTETK